MTPALRAILADDDLLDRLARRSATAQDVADPVTALLAALAADVDAGPPLEGGRLAPVPTRQRQPTKRALGVGGAVALAMLLVSGSAGVAAAVTGDPAGAFGVRVLRAAVSGRGLEASSSQQRRLVSRLDAAGRRPGGPDLGEVQRLQAEANRLPDQGGPLVRQRLAALVTAARAAGAPSGMTGQPPNVGRTSATAPTQQPVQKQKQTAKKQTAKKQTAKQQAPKKPSATKQRGKQQPAKRQTARKPPVKQTQAKQRPARMPKAGDR